MIGTITLLNGNTISRCNYLQYRASLHAGATEELVKICLVRCERGDQDFPEDFPESLINMAEEICLDISRSGGEVDPVVEEQIHARHTRTETPPEAPQEESEGDVATEVLEATPCTNELVLRGALETRLDNGGYSRLAEIFVFDDTMSEIRVKEGAIETPEHAGMLLGFGADLGRKGIWVCVQGAQRLMVKGLSEAMEQACASLKLSPQSIYNYLGTLPYATPEARQTLPPTVLVQICRSRYSDDDAVNDSIKKEMVEEAIKDQWDASTARSHARMRKGKDDPVEGRKTLREQLSEADREIAKLKGALHEIAIIHNSDSGGDWDEIEQARFVARKALGIPEPSIVEQAEQEAA